MKTKILTILIIAMATTVLFVGCGAPVVTQDPNTGLLTTNYAPNATATQAGTLAKQLAPTAATTIPGGYGPLIGLALGLVGTFLAGGAKVVANIQTKRANTHETTIQSIGTGVENALPVIQEAINAAMQSGSLPVSSQQGLAISQKILTAVKDNIASATAASGTAKNLDNVLADAGMGPSAK